MNSNEFVQSNTIYRCYAGSLIYGTNHSDSDVDVRGICVMPKDYYYGLFSFEQQECKETDTVIYDIKKFFQLAMGCNPNIIELLFVAPQHILHKTPVMDLILENRHLFLSQKLYHTFRGYSIAQKRKIIDKNPTGKRKDLIDKYGYDVKYGLHLIRLMTEAVELLKSGQLTLPLYNNKELLDIRLGKVPYDELLGKFEQLEKLVDLVYATTTLPHHPDQKKISDLLIKCIEKHWEVRNVAQGMGLE